MDQELRRRYESWKLVGAELQSVFKSLPADDYDTFVRNVTIVDGGRIFFFGQGRSGLSAQMGAMRFMHLGLRAHVVGEVTAPSVQAGDTLVIVSGSGRTPVSVQFAQIAKSQGSRVVLITHQEHSPLRAIADGSIVLPAAGSKQFGGSLFEQSALILLDSVVLELARNLPDPDATIRRNHTNLQ